jgi:hypothetical protein
MREKGQASLELIIITGVIILIVISILPFVTQQNTLNKAVVAARDGGTYAISMLNMGYTTSFNESISYPTDRWRLTDIDITFDGKVDNVKNYNISLYIDTGEDDPPSSTSGTGQFLGAIATNYIFYAFNADWTTVNSSLWTNGVSSGDYKFNVNANFEGG